jgi:hypothetical protein
MLLSGTFQAQPSTKERFAESASNWVAVTSCILMARVPAMRDER